MEIKRQKEIIRQRICAERSALKVLNWQQATDDITREIIACEWFREAADLYCYMDFNKEVGTRQIITEAWRLRKNVWLPKVEGAQIEFYQAFSFDELHPGPFGILEPEKDRKANGKNGLMIVPGVAFDKNLNRIGYGKGYYDRFLSIHSKLHTIAVAFDLQIVDDNIPSEVQDIRPEVLITESRTY